MAQEMGIGIERVDASTNHWLESLGEMITQ
jgi:hypothetical protein